MKEWPATQSESIGCPGDWSGHGDVCNLCIVSYTDHWFNQSMRGWCRRLEDNNWKRIYTSNREPGISDPKRGRHFSKKKMLGPIGHYPYSYKSHPRNGKRRSKPNEKAIPS